VDIIGTLELLGTAGLLSKFSRANLTVLLNLSFFVRFSFF